MRTYRILSLDGGGVFGTHTAAVLDRLEAKWPGFVERCDLIAGTSIGGIIALGLARGLTTTELCQLFATRTAEIFSRGTTWIGRKLRWLESKLGWRSDYCADGMAKVLGDLLGDVPLSALEKNVAIQSFQLKGISDAPQGNGSDNPQVVRAVVFSQFNGCGNMLALDAGLATAAAPTYFPAHGPYVDGGVARNNPAMSAYTLAIKAATEPIEIRLFSIGREYPGDYVCRESADWGAFGWLPEILRWFTSANATATHEDCQALLGARYFRHAPLLPRNLDSGMDDVSLVGPLAEWSAGLDLSAELDWIKTNW